MLEAPVKNVHAPRPMADSVPFVQYHDPSRMFDVAQKRSARSNLSKRPRAPWGTSTRYRLTKKQPSRTFLSPSPKQSFGKYARDPTQRKANSSEKRVPAKTIQSPRPRLSLREVGSNLSDFESVIPVKTNSYITAISAFSQPALTLPCLPLANH